MSTVTFKLCLKYILLYGNNNFLKLKNAILLREKILRLQENISSKNYSITVFYDKTA